MRSAPLRKRTKLRVCVNTHPWAWFIPLSTPANVPGADLALIDVLQLQEVGIRMAIAVLRENFPQAAFTAISCRGQDAWNTSTFELAGATDARAANAFLTRLEQARRDILLTVQAAYYHLHPWD